MNKLLRLIGSIGIMVLFVFAVSYTQKIKTIDGVRVVQNGKTGRWGKQPKVSLDFVRTIGDIDTEDENLAFHLPSDIAFDGRGNMYILDSGNHRIQKFNPDGKYITTIGNRGQGPGEFYFPLSIDIDSDGYLYVSDPQRQRIQILKPSGAEYKTIKIVEDAIGIIRVSKSGQLVMGGSGSFGSFGFRELEKDKSLQNLLKVLNLDGEIQKSFGEKVDFKDILMNRKGNRFHFTVDNHGNIYVAFDYQNRIEKYSLDGKLLWRSNRKLNYSTKPPKAKSGIKRKGGMVEIRDPQMNRCSSGIAVDEEGKIWVITLKRQIKEDELIQTSIRASRGPGGERSMSISIDGNTDVIETDMYQLEVFDSDGILLGKLPLKHFVDDIRIEKDRLFLLDKMRGTQYYEYRIIDK